MSDYHEPWEALPEDARDIHRALTSLKEEIEAVDWYHQRVVLCGDETLKTVLAHNRDEEIEHACMTLEWLRRNMPVWDQELRASLFTEAEIGHEEPAGGDGVPRGGGDLGIGKLKGGD